VLRFALNGLRARPARTAMTALAIVLGVTLVAGTLIFADTIHRQLSLAFGDAERGAAVIVSGRSQLGDGGVQPPTVPARVLARIQGLPGVALAEGQIFDSASLVAADGRVLGADLGHPRAVSYLGPPFQALPLVRGRPPVGAHDVVVDEYTAQKQRYRLGERIAIATELPAERFTVVGVVRFRGSRLVAFSLPTAQRLFSKAGAFDRVAVAAAPGFAATALVREIRPLLEPQLVVRTAGAEAIREERDASSALWPLTRALLALGLVAIVVGAFVVFNVFSITVAQRTHELAVLRMVGASGRGLLALVVGEALLLGALAAAAAIGLGVALVAAIRALFTALGHGLPQGSIVVEPRTVAVCLAVGVGVTTLAGMLPARRAMRTSPIAAVRDDVSLQPASRSGRLAWLALLLCAAGLGLTLECIVAGAGVPLAVVAAALLIGGVALAIPHLLPRAVRFAAWPLERMTRLTGRIARENTARNPARAGASVASLMVGLALVVFVTIFSVEARAAIRSFVARSFAGDLAITGRTGSAQIPAGAARAVAAVPGVAVASVLKRSQATVRGAGRQSANGIDTQTLDSVYRFEWVSGDDSLLGFLGPNGALVERDLARRANLHVDDRFSATTPAGQAVELTVRGIYKDNALLPGFTIDGPSFTDLFHQQRARRILVKLAAGADLLAAQSAIRAALAGYPDARVHSEHQLADQEASRLDPIVYLFYALLAVSVIVALCGIAGTLALQIHERTRELGVLRALGLSRRSVRRLVRYESAITAAIGSALGLLLGVLLAAVVTASLANRDLPFELPWLRLAELLALALALGVLAATLPARRAARLDVLAAIAYE
jgi:putative ABC transport system permease protein